MDNISDEILLMILEFLSKEDLVKISLTCKRFLQVLKRIILPMKEVLIGKNINFLLKYTTIKPTFLKIVSDEYSSSILKEINRGLSYKKCLISFVPNLVKNVTIVLRANFLVMEETERINEFLDNVALLMLSCKNVEKFTIYVSSFNVDIKILHILLNIRNLKKLQIFAHGGIKSLTLDLYCLEFCKNLETLSTEHNEKNYLNIANAILQNSSSLKKLNLTIEYANTEIIMESIKKLPNIKTLLLNFKWRISVLTFIKFFILPKLKKLMIKHNWYEYVDAYDDRIPLLFRNISTICIGLRVLCIDIKFYQGVDDEVLSLCKLNQLESLCINASLSFSTIMFLIRDCKKLKYLNIYEGLFITKDQLYELFWYFIFSKKSNLVIKLHKYYDITFDIKKILPPYGLTLQHDKEYMCCKYCIN